MGFVPRLSVGTNAEVLSSLPNIEKPQCLTLFGIRQTSAQDTSAEDEPGADVKRGQVAVTDDLVKLEAG
jgi:hypothetical protein